MTINTEVDGLSVKYCFKFQAGQISHEEAILAKQQCIQDKKDLVQRLRNESQELMGQYFAQKQHEKQEMRRLVEATSAGQQNVREARARLTEMKLKIGTYSVTSVSQLGPNCSVYLYYFHLCCICLF